MRRVVKRGLMGLAGVAAAGTLTFAVATPAQAGTIDIKIRTFEDSSTLLGLCLTITPSPANCLIRL